MVTTWFLMSSDGWIEPHSVNRIFLMNTENPQSHRTKATIRRPWNTTKQQHVHKAMTNNHKTITPRCKHCEAFSCTLQRCWIAIAQLYLIGVQIRKRTTPTESKQNSPTIRLRRPIMREAVSWFSCGGSIAWKKEWLAGLCPLMFLYHLRMILLFGLL